MRLGFESVGGECVFTSELDPYAQRTYRSNFPDDHPLMGDIREVPVDSIPAFDVLLAGFPCQPFSISGVSKRNALGRPHGFACDTQGTLFFNVAEILRQRRPPAFLLENVKNLISHDGGRTFEVIRQILQDELGYETQWKVIDAARFVPQHRERIFIIGFRKPAGFSFESVNLPPTEHSPRLGSILHAENGTEEAESPYTTGRRAAVAEKYVLTDHLWSYLQGYAAKHRAAGNGFGFGLVGPHDVARTLSARYYKDGSEILVKRRSGPPRRLTPRECARLMGFDGERRFAIPVSDTRAYKQFGNAVVVPVISALATAMLDPLLTLLPGEPAKTGS